MFKVRNETIRLGTRFYQTISDDEYKIFVLVKFEEDNTAKFMDEETFELITISKTELEEDYVMLSDTLPFIIVKYNGVIFINEHVRNLYYQALMCTGKPLEIDSSLVLDVYKYIKKEVFYRTLNYILNLNSRLSLSEDLDTIWKMYFSYMSQSCYVMQINYEGYNPHIDMKDVVDNDAKLPDSLFIEAEEILNTYILSYEVYEYDDSVNIDNVGMKHFFIYDVKEDKYYIMLYVLDTSRISRERIQNMRDNMDVVEFMLK